MAAIHPAGDALKGAPLRAEGSSSFAPFGADTKTTFRVWGEDDSKTWVQNSFTRSVAEVAAGEAKMDHSSGHSNDVGVATVLAAMAVMNTEAIAKAIDPEGRAKVMQQGADETKLALSKANEALRMGDVTRELSKDVAPLLTEMKALTEKIALMDERMDQRLQTIEQKPACCTIS